MGVYAKELVKRIWGWNSFSKNLGMVLKVAFPNTCIFLKCTEMMFLL
jgi:hypothetical protein